MKSHDALCFLRQKVTLESWLIKKYHFGYYHSVLAGFAHLAHRSICQQRQILLDSV